MSSGPLPEEGWKKRKLAERARALARRVATEVTREATLDTVELVLAAERYALETRWVREVLSLTDLVPLPGTPTFVLGIINVRGEVVSVVELRRFLGLPERALTDLNKVIVLASDTLTFAILADAVLGVRSIPLQSLHPAPPTLSDRRRDYLLGVTQDALTVLDAGKLLTEETLIVHDSLGD